MLGILVLVLAIVGAVIGGAVWFADMSADQREAKVRKEFSDAIERTNVDVREFTATDDKLAAIVEAARKQATEAAMRVVGKKCEATEDQARALNEIPQ